MRGLMSKKSPRIKFHPDRTENIELKNINIYSHIHLKLILRYFKPIISTQTEFNRNRMKRFDIYKNFRKSKLNKSRRISTNHVIMQSFHHEDA